MLQEGISKGAVAIPAEPMRRQKRIDRRFLIKFTNALIGWMVPLVIVMVWQAAGALGWLNPILLPTPLAIWNELVHLTSTGELIQHLGISSWRALLGFLLGGSLGLAAGIWVGFSYKAERLVDPSLQMLRTLPHLAIAPLFILWFGFGETSKILLIAKGSFFPLYVNTFLGIRSVDNRLFDVARVLQFSRWDLILRLIVPASLPNIFLGIRLSIGVAWLGLVVAELMGSSSGIGYIINDARSFSWTTVVFVGIIVFALVGKLSDSLVKWLEGRLLRWQDSYKGGDKS
ncbi:ABC transporter permease [Paenibacillus glucanolyticus]|jgi:sulfonate transport system permease protein|uniref:ABC transporter permease n=2 Tax=Paenibacillus TaxID=44249 RepID=UPI0003E20433|nr:MULTISPECIES: ABC transporter permease [Paenibacillus]AVV58072.1 ABC transporter permease [Paenibacillus glucanolyticus]ETT42815.1 binding-protein-dependent transport systems inner membrane component [Paenibacillus sp. FSL R5-808]MPY17862.1 ABC transporter permease [Paenibacillus glucanolyticus]